MLPTIEDGQIVLVDRTFRRVREDAVYAVTVGDDVRIKRIQKGADGRLTLRSDNANYAPELLAADEAERLKIEGRVFWTEKVL